MFLKKTLIFLIVSVLSPILLFAQPLVLDGTGDIVGENIQHPSGNVFDQILLAGETIRLQAKPNQITRVSFMDETEDIVQVEFSGAGSFTVTLDPATFLPAAIPPRYNQDVEYVTGKPSVVVDGADSSTFLSIFTVGSINAVNQALFPEGQVYDAQADATLVEVVNSTGMGGMQLSNTAFSGSTGKVGVDARGVPIAVRLTIGDIDASGDAVPHLLFGSGSFTVPAGNLGLRITGGDLLQTNGTAVVVAESGSTAPGFETLITQNNFKSDSTPQPTLSINATFANEDGDVIEVTIENGGRGNSIEDTLTPLNGLRVTEGGGIQYRTGALTQLVGSGNCIYLSNSSINGVVYTVHKSQWQRREGSTWVDIPGTERDALCGYGPATPGEYRVVVDMSIDGERVNYYSENTLILEGEVMTDPEDEQESNDLVEEDARTAPGNEQEFNDLAVGMRATSDHPAYYTDFVSSGRFRETEGSDIWTGSYTYRNTGPNTGTVTFNYDDGDRCTSSLTFASATMGTSTYTCDDGSSGESNWGLVEIP